MSKNVSNKGVGLLRRLQDGAKTMKSDAAMKTLLSDLVGIQDICISYWVQIFLRRASLEKSDNI
jgi:hypothetical protein